MHIGSKMPETRRQIRVFLCHASQDKPVVRELYQRLNAEGWVDAWLDEKRLLPGQDWRLSIEEAVETSDVVIICLSSNSVSKEGFVQKELRYAREIAFEKLEGSIFLIPLRIDECDVPRGLRFYQWADYFGENKEETYHALLESLKLRHNQKLRIEKEAHASQERAKQEREVAEKIAREKALRDDAEKALREKAEEEKVKCEVSTKAVYAKEQQEIEKHKREVEKKPIAKKEQQVAKQKSFETPKPQVAETQQIKNISGKSQRNIYMGIGIFTIVCISIFCSAILFPRLFQNPPAIPSKFPTRKFSIPTVTLIPPSKTLSPAPSPTQAPIPTETSFPPEIKDGYGVSMILVPESEFVIGNDYDDATDNPAHVVYIDSYYIDEYEVTNALYKECVKLEVCKMPAPFEMDKSYHYDSKYDNYPVLNVDWDMANTYCSFRIARLPTEAEWEKAARGEKGLIYPWGEKEDATLANTSSNFPAPVGSFQSDISPYGVYDMAGNAHEWVSDWYDVYPNGDPNASKDFGHTLKVVRGGGLLGLAQSSTRSHIHPSGNPWNQIVGFHLRDLIY
jgi:formylglycine-generating enzyme required for sulfatase activity